MPQLEDMTISQLLRRSAARYPRRPALEYRGQVWDYETLDRAVDRTARRLMTWGVQKGEHVGLWCEAEPNAILVLYALARLGAVTTMLNTSLPRTELEGLLRCTDVKRLVIGDGYKDLDYPSLCRGLEEALPGLQGVLYAGRRDCPEGYLPLDGLAEGGDEALQAAEAAVRPQDTALILYTSGTTSLPKAVMGSHYSRVNSGIQQARDLGATELDRFCVAMPIFHCFCLSVNVMAACAAGACLYLPPSRRTTDLLEAVSQGRCTIMSSVPALFRAMMVREDFAHWDLSSLRTGFIGGSICPPDLFRRINDSFGFTLLSSLGQTEATAGITTAGLQDPLEVRATTVGHFMNHVEGRIVDPVTGTDLPQGENGEICVRGYVVMQGYYKNPKATAQAVDGEGWLHTGDMGYLDGAGNVRLTGRLKELIIRGGENISPAEVEAAVSHDGRIQTCKAVGVPDEHYGEEVCLCLVLRPDAQLEERELREMLAGRLAAYKVPRYILFLEEIPRTMTGKIRPAALANLARERLGLHQPNL